ncbi:hypothetical protein K1719_007287 [Acacia pycnantha]|nr:hypothetical protein K1719_007287 [Acacia pycnantha]
MGFSKTSFALSDCNLVHSGGAYGKNLAQGSGGREPVVSESRTTITRLTLAWEGQQCLHYAQVVWRNSVRVGCARVHGNNGWWIVSCNYDPPGNYVGQRASLLIIHKERKPSDQSYIESM